MVEKPKVNTIRTKASQTSNGGFVTFNCISIILQIIYIILLCIAYFKGLKETFPDGCSKAIPIRNLIFTQIILSVFSLFFQFISFVLNTISLCVRACIESLGIFSVFAKLTQFIGGLFDVAFFIITIVLTVLYFISSCLVGTQMYTFLRAFLLVYWICFALSVLCICACVGVICCAVCGFFLLFGIGAFILKDEEDFFTD